MKVKVVIKMANEEKISKKLILTSWLWFIVTFYKKSKNLLCWHSKIFLIEYNCNQRLWIKNQGVSPPIRERVINQGVSPPVRERIINQGVSPPIRERFKIKGSI